ncbi:MAG: hypothetical protein AVDCRST_MAG65-2174, partial [uncultured Solirubrobacteraceae bacterium]
AHRHRHRLHAAPLLGPVRRRRQAALRRRAALRAPAHVGSRSAASRAAARLCRRDALRRERPRRGPVRRCGRDRSPLACGRPLHPHHLSSGGGVQRRHDPLAERHRAALRPPALLLRQDLALRRAQRGPAGRRLTGQPRQRPRCGHGGRHHPAPVERRRLRVRAGDLRRRLAGARAGARAAAVGPHGAGRRASRV